jgi:hypothetical protein
VADLIDTTALVRLAALAAGSLPGRLVGFFGSGFEATAWLEGGS